METFQDFIIPASVALISAALGYLAGYLLDFLNWKRKRIERYEERADHLRNAVVAIERETFRWTIHTA